MTDLADELERLEQALMASDEIGAPEVFCTRETARAILSALRGEWQGIETATDMALALAEIAAKATLAADMCDDEGRASGFRILAADARAALPKGTDR